MTATASRARPTARLSAGLARLVEALRSPWLVLVALTWAVMVLAALRPLGDIDMFFHVRVGDDILTHHRFTGDPAWVFGPQGHWVTTQWLCEVLFAGLHAAFGWAGLVVFNVLSGVALLATLTWLLRRVTGTPLAQEPVACLGFAATGVAFAFSLQERPAMVSFVFLLVLSGWAWQALTTGRWPHWWLVAGTTWLWAQVHGYWILVPVVVGLVGLLRLAQTRDWAGCRPALALGALTTVAGGLTPAGLYGYLAPLTFRRAAVPFIAEWQHPTFAQPTQWVPNGVLLVAGVVFVAAVGLSTARRVRVPVTQIVWVALWLAFAWSAARNVVPALVLILPVLTATTMTVRPGSLTRVRGSLLTVAVAVALVPGAALAGSVGLARHGLFEDSVPDRLVAHILAQPGPRRVLNDYGAGDYVLGFATSSRIRVAIDTRCDKYGYPRIRSHFALIAADPGWRRRFAAYRPTDVLVRRWDGLNARLPALGWVPVGTEGPYRLWEPAPTP